VSCDMVGFLYIRVKSFIYDIMTLFICTYYEQSKVNYCTIREVITVIGSRSDSQFDS